MRRTAILLAALGLSLFAVGVSLVPLQTPGFTRTLSSRYSHAAEAGLSTERMLSVAESVRSYVVERRGELPESVDGTTAFGPDAVSHLDDVARVLAAVRGLVLVLGVALAAAGLVAWRRGCHGDIAQALMAGAAATVALPLAATGLASLDFDAFFALFHSLFFAEGTWTFPSDSLLIRTFPEPFWMAAGLAWAMLILGCSAVYAVCGMVTSRLSARREDDPRKTMFDQES